jgi:hypothetical protein
MKSPTGTQTSNAWMIRIGWSLTGLTSANMIADSFGKFLPPAQLLEEVHRLGESESTLYLRGERLRNLIPLRASLVRREITATTPT